MHLLRRRGIWTDQTANQMLAALEKNKARLQASGVIYSIVQRTLIPHIDLNRMAGSVVGRDYWSKASASQHKHLFENSLNW